MFGVYSFLIKTNSADSLRRTWQAKLNYFVVFCASRARCLAPRDLNANALSFLALPLTGICGAAQRDEASARGVGGAACWLPFDRPVRATASTESACAAAALFVIL